MRNDRPWVAAQMSNMPSQAEKYAEAHCDTLVDWLKKNTKPCACVDKYELDSGKDRFGLEEKRRLQCRRCYVPLGMKEVSLHTLHSTPRTPVSAGPAPPLCVARARHGTTLCGKRSEAHARCHIPSKRAAAVAVAAGAAAADVFSRRDPPRLQQPPRRRPCRRPCRRPRRRPRRRRSSISSRYRFAWLL